MALLEFFFVLNSQDIPADLEMGMSTSDQPLGFPNSSSNGSSHPTAAVEVVSSAQANFLRDFKRFETVEEFSDHHYISKGNASKQVMVTYSIISSVRFFNCYVDIQLLAASLLSYQHSKTWVKKILADWKILENDLPGLVYIYIYILMFATYFFSPICY